jgi:hypothetical protein
MINRQTQLPQANAGEKCMLRVVSKLGTFGQSTKKFKGNAVEMTIFYKLAIFLHLSDLSPISS